MEHNKEMALIDPFFFSPSFLDALGHNKERRIDGWIVETFMIGVAKRERFVHGSERGWIGKEKQGETVKKS